MIKKTPIIGLTGGAGSGKSYVADLLHTLARVTHINTDDISREQMKKGGSVYRAVAKHFGKEFLDEYGEIDRSKLGEYVFARPEELSVLNSLTHPAVRGEVEHRIQAARQSDTDIILLESALLIEAGYREICDEIWYVYCKRSIRKKRLQETRGYSKERISELFRRQNTDRFFRAHADRIIENNDNSIASVTKQLQKYRNKL